jgi:hypothetical protein
MTRGPVVAAVCVAALAACVPLGRWEHRRMVDDERAGMAAAFRAATAQGLRSRALDAYRLAPAFDCLLYRTGSTEPYGLELCFDPQGGLVETIDRRTRDVRISSLRAESREAGIVIPPARLLKAFAQVGMFSDDRIAGLRLSNDLLPVGFDDVGPRGGGG